MNQRQKLLVHILTDTGDWVTGVKLSTMLHVSDRTVRADIARIRELIDDSAIQSNKRYGYRITPKSIQFLPTEQMAEKVSQDSTPKGQERHTLNHLLYSGNWINPKDRGIYILHRLLYTDSWVTLTSLGNECFICDSVLENDLRKVRRILGEVEGLTLCRQKRRLRLVGDEKHKRALLVKLIWNDAGCDLLNMNSLNSYFTTVDLQRILGILEAVLLRHNYHIRAVDLSGLLLYAGITVQRIMEHHIVSHADLPLVDFAGEQDEAVEIATEFFEDMDFLCRKPISEEVRCLAYFLRESRDLAPDETCAIGVLLEQVLQKVYENYQVDLRTDKILVRMLEHHIASLFSKNWIMNFENPLSVQDIKIRFPLVFEIACFLCNFLESETGRNITEREIGFIALHLQCSYQRMCEAEQYKILLISPYSRELTSYCTQRLYAILGNRISLITCLPFYDEARVQSESPDITLTTAPIETDVQNPIIQISILMSEENENSIVQQFNRLDTQRFRSKYLSWMSALVRPEFFFTSLEADSPKEIIRFLCGKLQEAEYADSSFTDSVLAREALSSTGFELRFALPHSMNRPSNRSVLMVAFLKKPVLWGNYEVSLVMLPAIAAADKEITRVFFNWLGDVIADVQQMSTLLSSRSWETFTKLFQN